MCIQEFGHNQNRCTGAPVPQVFVTQIGVQLIIAEICAQLLKSLAIPACRRFPGAHELRALIFVSSPCQAWYERQTREQ